VIDRLYDGGEDVDGLALVRVLVARVRDEHAGVEPPQAVSARLLQAAEELAPKRAAVAVEEERPGLWARVRSWLMPTSVMLAAAAVLVLWVKQDQPPAEPTIEKEHAATPEREEKKESESSGAGLGSAAAPELEPAATLPEPASADLEPAEPEPAEPAEEEDRNAQAETKKREPKPAAKDNAPAGGKRGGNEKNAFEGGFAVGEDDGEDVAKAADEGGPGRDVSSSDKGGPESTAKVTVKGDVDGRVGGGATGGAGGGESSGTGARGTGGGGASGNGAGGTSTGDNSRGDSTTETVAQEAPPPPPKDAPVAEKGKKAKKKPAPKTAAQLTAEARTAAKRGDCKKVETLAAQVKALDAAYYRDTFQTDPSIRTCRK
jgi:hypothetical protein